MSCSRRCQLWESSSGQGSPSLLGLPHAALLGLPHAALLGLTHAALLGLTHAALLGLIHAALLGLTHAALACLSAAADAHSVAPVLPIPCLLPVQRVALFAGRGCCMPDLLLSAANLAQLACSWQQLHHSQGLDLQTALGNHKESRSRLRSTPHTVLTALQAGLSG